MENLLNRIEEIAETYESAKATLVDELEPELGKVFKEIMTDSEKIYSYRFTQYAPHFNDGDPCEFESNHQYGSFFGPVLFDEDGYKIEFEDGDELSDYLDCEVSGDDIARMKKFKAILDKVPEDFYKDAFGESSEITINRDGSVEVDEKFEHD